MRIKNGTIFAKEGTSPQEVFFLLKGCVLCEKQEKYYLEGTMFGEADIILKRNRQDSYIAKSDCYILKLDSNVFE
jgi:CRP-like cAMP-binding protein